MAKRIGILVVLVLAVLAIVNRDLIISWFSEEKTINNHNVKVLLREDPNLDGLLKTLHGKKIIADIESAREIAEELGIKDGELEGGKYIVEPGRPVEKVLQGFKRDKNGKGKDEKLVNVIFNTCRDLNDVAKSVSDCIAVDSTSLFEYLVNPETLKKYGFSKEQMPALILPKQYQMEFDTNEEEFVEFMAARFREFWTEDRKQKLAQIGLKSPSQAVTIASIVYSEQGRIQEEWPIIASLYLNRLDKGMKLQSDPTFKFCWGRELDNVQVLTYKHREIDCPYNTYKVYGLPPGPICITPAKVVDAVLNHANVDYIYMCAKPDYSGEHNFAVDLNDHNANAKAYQAWIREQL